ncbi:MAG: hypothetical protein KAS90_06320 [Candidatus Aenigmarchaeota archaeon]|nr:hypothetical protein [Candidatus Aenigmarchaeota archaeon]
MNKPGYDTEFLETFANFSPTNGQYQEIKKHFPDIKLVGVENEKGTYDILDPSDLKDDDQINLYWDIKFFEKTLWLPDENFCSRLDNYIPKNETQQDLLDAVYHLLDLDKGSAGLLISGEVSTGKTHCSVGASKELMKKRSNTFYFMTEDHFYFNKKISFEPDSIFILDDLNNPYSFFKDRFLEIVQFVHDKGGRIFVTTNKEPDSFLKNALAINDNKERILDRMKGLFYVLEIEGQSERTSKTWYEALEQ